MTIPLLSIITPVFNVEDYLDDFIASLRSQSFKDWELVLIDDGSTDMSGIECDNFAQSDSRIKVIHQENSGVSNARNRGLDYAKGRYILFADSDDKFEPEALSELSKMLLKKKKEITFLPYNEFLVNGQHSKVSSFQNLETSSSITSFFESLIKRGEQIPWATFQIVYDSTFIGSNNIRFDNNDIGAEDLKVLLEVITKNPSFSIFPDPVINYRLKKKFSLNNTIDYKSVMNRLRTFREMSDYFYLSASLHMYFIQNFANIVVQINDIEDIRGRKLCFNYVNENKQLLFKVDGNLKYRISRYVWQLLGLKIGTKVLGKIKCIQRK